MAEKSPNSDIFATRGAAGSALDDANSEIRFEKSGCAGVITLDRPKALNALNDAMRAGFEPNLRAWAVDPDIYGVIIRSGNDRAFCVGGDVRELHRLGREGRGRASLACEYALNWRLERYTKPVVSLINGMVMGSGVGLTRYNTHRVAGENYQFAMPEAGIGFFPDVGATWFLSNLQDEVGTYLGLTGVPIGRAEAFALGLVSHVIDSDRYGEIEAAIADADPVDPVLDDMHRDPGDGELAGLREVIRVCFSAATVEEIIARVEAVQPEGSDRLTVWRDESLKALGQNSPTSLKVTLRQLRQGRGRDLRDALKLEYRLATRFLQGRDFYEGVRAHLIDKDRKPVWQPQALADVTEEMVAAYFAPLEEGELDLEA